MTEDLRIPEILAPAGGREQFFAALNAGADAVFLGLKTFNARARAENFTVEDLLELVPLAHRYDMKVLVTVNVLIKQDELPQLVQLLGELEAAEVDAIIVQDIGVARLAKACFPGLRLHASTQLAVHNLAGVRKAQALGFKRVVLAREMTAVELRKIRSLAPREEVELEAFCHGSLCYSYSGLCFFSGAEDARSGNRGECSYTCRQPYKILGEDQNAFLFSMRDLDTSKHIDQLVRAGVDTLKIEGRKKDAQYVASAVRLYRAKLDEIFGRSTLRANAPRSRLSTESDPSTEFKVEDGPTSPTIQKIEQDLALTFHRQPTTFFLKGRYHENVIDLDNPTHQGIEIGRVTKSLSQKIWVKLSGSVERFDGLRIMSPHDIDRQSRYNNDVLEFSLREMSLKGKRVFSALAQAEIEITMPPGVCAAKAGDVVYKTRSADLKRRVAQLATPPEDTKLRPLKCVSLHFQAEPREELLSLTIYATKYGELVAQHTTTFPMTKARGSSTLEQDINDTFTIMGNSGFLASALTYSGDKDWFVPRSLVKKCRESFEAVLATAYDNWCQGRIARAHSFLASSLSSSAATALQSAALSEPYYSVKTDRLEILDTVLDFSKSSSSFNLKEIIFEPKRSFLPNLDPDELSKQLLDLEKAHNVPLRIALPTVIRAWDEPLLARWVKALYQKGLRRFELGNIGAFELLQSWDFDLSDLDLSGDFTLYALNACSTRAWLELGLSTVCVSIEDDRTNLSTHLKALSSDERDRLSAIVFKDTPLFIAEACSLTALHQGCPTSKVCGYRTLTIQNPRGETFYVAHETCKSVVYGHEAYALSHKQAELCNLGLQNLRIDFLTRPYLPTRIQEILSSITSRNHIPETHAANWERSLL
jgi:putative protease